MESRSLPDLVEVKDLWAWLIEEGSESDEVSHDSSGDGLLLFVASLLRRLFSRPFEEKRGGVSARRGRVK